VAELLDRVSSGEGGLREDLEWRMLPDGLNDVEVSKGVLGCLDMCHHPEKGQVLTTTYAPLPLFCLLEPTEKKLKERSW